MPKTREQNVADLRHILEVVLEVDPEDSPIKKALDNEGITHVDELISLPPSHIETLKYVVKASNKATTLKSLPGFSVAFLKNFQQYVNFYQKTEGPIWEIWTSLTHEKYMDFVCSGIDPSTIPTKASTTATPPNPSPKIVDKVKEFKRVYVMTQLFSKS